MLVSLCLRNTLCLFCDVVIGGAVGLHTSLEWVSNVQFDNVDFALNYKKVVDSFNTCVGDNNEIECNINACKQLFQHRFQNSHVEFDKSQTNGVAHLLMKVAPCDASSHVFDDVP
jgi:hypothetical protein